MIILLVEDEFPTRQELRYVLSQLLPEATFYEASNSEEAMGVLQNIPIEVAFLDINMPGENGLQLASKIITAPEPPLIVFATAYNEHALKAFEFAALDYVVKPFSKRRLTKTVEQIRKRLGDKHTLQHQQTLIAKFLDETSKEKSADKLWVEQKNGTRRLLEHQDIAYFEARNKQVFAIEKNGTRHKTRYTLKELAIKLESAGFCQSHKAYLVNVNLVKELIPWFSGSYQLTLHNLGEQIPVSRRFAGALKEKLAWG